MRFSLKGTWKWFTGHPKVGIGLAITLLFVIPAIIGPAIFQDPNRMNPADPMDPPSAAHLLGTTLTGQDVFQQMVVGTRTSLLLCFGIGLSATLLSTVIGTIAGYFGGLVDDILSLLINIFLVIPALPLAVVLNSYLKSAGDLPIFWC